jgi:hypothetical protein
LLFGPLTVGSLTFDVHTLAYAQVGVVLSMLLIFTGSILRAFAFREGLLPSRYWLAWIRQYPVFEFGTLFSLATMCLGIFWAVDAVIYWGNYGFGSIGGYDLARTVSISSTLMIVSGLVFIWSLVMGFIALPVRKSN